MVTASDYIKWEGKKTFEQIIQCHIRPLEGLCKIASIFASSALSQINHSPANVFRQNNKGIVKETLEHVELLLAEAQSHIGQMETVLRRIEKDLEQKNETHNSPDYLVDLTWMGSATFDFFSSYGLLPLKSLFDIANIMLFEVSGDTKGELEKEIDSLTHLITYMANRVRTLDVAVIDLMDEYFFAIENRAGLGTS